MYLPDLGAPRRALQRILFAVSAVCLGTFAAAHGESLLYQAVEDRRLEASSFRDGPVAAGPSASVPRVAPVEGAAPRPAGVRHLAVRAPLDVLGRLEIPRLGLRTIVARGIEPRTLRRAAGHVPGTALPGEPGNVGIAAHRDLHFRRLEGVEEGDRVRLVTPEGAYEYVVESLQVVEPDRVDVLEPTPEPSVTLVTCHPFSLVGRAPQRLVVRARQVSAPPTD